MYFLSSACLSPIPVAFSSQLASFCLLPWPGTVRLVSGPHHWVTCSPPMSPHQLLFTVTPFTATVYRMSIWGNWAPEAQGDLKISPSPGNKCYVGEVRARKSDFRTQACSPTVCTHMWGTTCLGIENMLLLFQRESKEAGKTGKANCLGSQLIAWPKSLNWLILSLPLLSWSWCVAIHLCRHPGNRQVYYPRPLMRESDVLRWIWWPPPAWFSGCICSHVCALIFYT